MLIGNVVWYWPRGSHHFLLQWAASIVVIVLVVTAGRFVTALRPWICGAAYVTMPVSGLLLPMRKHLGDGSWELLQYLHQRKDWKAGELLGTFPFYELGRHSLALRAIGDRDLALALSLAGLVGAAGFLVLAVQLSRPLTAPLRGASWLEVVLHLSRSDLGYFYLLAFASLPSFLMYAGFIQTTFVSSLLLPWTLVLLVRASAPAQPGRIAIAAHLAWVLAAWLAIALLYLSHGACIVILLGAASAALARFGRMLLDASRRRRLPPLREWLVSGLQAVLALATLPAVARFTRWMTLAYPRIWRDGWVPASGSAEDRLLALRRITHAIPSWVPAVGQQHPTCGQQTWLFSRDWALFAASSLAHVTPLPLLASWGAWSLVRRARGRALAPHRRSIPGASDLFACAVFGLGFILIYSPHFSQPRDMDVIFVAGSTIGVFAIATVARWRDGGDGPMQPPVRWMAAIAVCQLVLLFASRIAQSELDVPIVRGVSGPWC